MALACDMRSICAAGGVGESSASWYALYVRSNAERNVSAVLRARGYQPYLPTYRRQKRWSDRVKSLDVALFPGYVFCRLNPWQAPAVVSTPGVVSILGTPDGPLAIPDHEIAAVERIAGSGLPAMPWPFIREGDRVRITRGALTDVEGILLKAESQFRIVVSVELLRRSVAVEIDRSWVEPVGKLRRSAW